MDKDRSKNRESPDKKSGKWFGLAAAAISIGFDNDGYCGSANGWHSVLL